MSDITVSGGTTAGNILPAATGQTLGNSGQRWDVYVQNLNVSGTVTANSSPGSAGQQFVGPGSWQTKPILDVRDYGATGNGTTDDSAAIQAAIDAANAAKGGTVYLPVGKYKCNLTLKRGVNLAGVAAELASYEAAPNDAPVQLLDGSLGASPVVAVASGAANWALKDVYVRGTGSGAADRGLYIVNANRGIVERVTFDNFGEEAIRWVAGLELHLNKVKSVNCLLTRTRVSHFGTVYMAGTDGYISDSEFNASTNALVSSNMYIAALMLKGSNHFVKNTVMGFSDVGLYIDPSSTANMIEGSRVEFNYGHGAWNEGSATFVDCKADSNSQSAANTYDGFYTTGANSLYVGNRVVTTSGNAHRYGYNDTQSSDANKNFYANNNATDYLTAKYNTSNTAGAAVTLGDTPPITISSGTTPSVDGYSFVVLTHGSPATITNFTNGVNGQHLWIKANANITFQHNGTTIYTANAANEVAEANKIYHFVNAGGAWYEQALPKNLVLGGTVTSYNGIATVSNGVPAEYAAVDLTGQAAAIGTTTLYAVTSSGQYRLVWNSKVTTVDAVSSTLGALTIVYTDPDGVAQTITAGALTSAGAIATTSTTNTTAAVLLGVPLILNCKAGTNITYAFAYVSNTPGSMKYNLHMKLEAL